VQEDLAPSATLSSTNVETEADLAGMVQSATSQKLDAWDVAVARRDRTSYVENAFNDRQQGTQVLRTDVDPRYRFGKRFNLPLLAIPADAAAFAATQREFPGSAAARALLHGADGAAWMPVHPQMADARRKQSGRADDEAPERVLGARTASSERTVRIVADGHELQLKLDLADVENSHFIRPVEMEDGRSVVRKSDLLAAWFDAHPTAAARVAFEPEIAVVGDVTNGYAAIVRDSVPYPPPITGEATWPLKMYSLTAQDPNGVQGLPRASRPTPPLIARLIDQRPDPSVDRVAYATEKILRPLVEAALTIHIDWGASANFHMQNSALEIGEDGHPTGRVIISDLEDIHLRPHDPTLLQAAKESGVVEDVPVDGAFKSFDHWAVAYNLNELRRALEKAFPSEGSRFRKAINDVIQEGLEARRETVLASANVEPEFARLLERGASY
jgi:hypothetical protein